MINRVHELIPKLLADELIRLARIDRDWCQWENLESGTGYSARAKVATWMSKYWVTGADAFAMWAASTWLIDGPKIFRPTAE